MYQWTNNCIWIHIYLCLAIHCKWRASFVWTQYSSLFRGSNTPEYPCSTCSGSGLRCKTNREFLNITYTIYAIHVYMFVLCVFTLHIFIKKCTCNFTANVSSWHCHPLINIETWTWELQEAEKRETLKNLHFYVEFEKRLNPVLKSTTRKSTVNKITVLMLIIINHKLYIMQYINIL